MVMFRFARRDDVGAVAVITAICSVLLFGVAALTVDIGRLWEVRRQSQSEVDLAALAGAMHLRDSDQTAACTVALQYLRDNTPAGQDPGDIDPNGDCSASGTADGQIEINSIRTRITVRTHTKIVNFGLAGALGFKNGGTAAQATAEIRSPGGMDPFAVAANAAYGAQCIHDNSNGQNRAISAALLPRVPLPDGTVTTVTPNQVGIGETPTITITGTGLNQVNTVVFSGGVSPATNVASSATQVTMKPPSVTSPVGPVDITLEKVTGNSTTVIATATNAISWVWITPVISSITPALQGAGQQVTIDGQHFGGGTPAVTFTNGTTTKTSPLVSVSNAGPNASLTAQIPAGITGAVNVTVTNTATPTAQTSNQFPYVIAAPPPPAVTSVSPTSGPTAGGTLVTITGNGFAPGTTVTFGGTAGTGVNPAPGGNSLTVTTPAHAAGTVNVVVTIPGNPPITAAQQFTFGAAPTITSISPTTGKAGDSIVINGTDLTGTFAVFFGQTAATTFTVNSATKITATVPSGSGTVDVTVSTLFGSSQPNNNDLFTYIVDSCGVVTGDFGYLDVPRNDSQGQNTNLQQNILLGLDHIPSIYPAPPQASAPNNQTVLQLPFDQKCSASDPNVILDPQQPTYPDGMNCLDIANGNKVSDAGAAFLDGMNGVNGGKGKLIDPQDGGKTYANYHGRSNVDADSFFDFLQPGVSSADISADLTTVLNATQAIPELPQNYDIPLLNSDQDLINPAILDCPRFTILPVMHIDKNPQNGQYAIQDFVGAFIEDFQFQGNGPTPQVQSIKAITFPLNWIQGGAASDGTIPFLGTGPIVPVLVK